MRWLWRLLALRSGLKSPVHLTKLCALFGLFRWLLVSVGIGLAACAPAPNPNVIYWDRSPDSIVFRIDVVGGATSPLDAFNDIPRCTIYGDNLVVWVNNLGGFETQVLVDRVPDAAIIRFIEYLTVSEQIYTFTAPAPPTAQGGSPKVATATISVAGLTHTANALGGWDDDWFERVSLVCASLSQAPVLFVPAGGWLSAVTATYTVDTPASLWRADELGVRLAEVEAGGQAVWITGEPLRQLWETQRTAPPNHRWAEEGRYYQLALQIPGVTRASPPAPGTPAP
jgi:hypothetical protein